MSQLFPAFVARTNCSYIKEEPTSNIAAVPLKAFGTKYINDGPMVYRIETVPMSQWDIKRNLDNAIKYLNHTLISIENQRDYLKSIAELKHESCNWSKNEIVKTEEKLKELELNKKEYEDTIKFCNLYIIKG